MRRKFILWASLYSIIVIYCSTVVGPDGLNFVPINLHVAWTRFLATPFLNNGSDQRADWVANLLMLVPIGFLLTGALDLKRGIVPGLASSLLAIVVCVTFVLMVKFVQLYFPPRTVSLNYIVAQTIGSAAGIVSYWLCYPKLLRFRQVMGTPAALLYLLTAYALAWVAFQLLPFNFTLSYSDLQERLQEVRHLLLGWPASGRPIMIRLVLIAVDMLAAVPLGFLLGLRARRASISTLGMVSAVVMTSIVTVKIFLISGTPYLVSIFYRTVAMLAGIELSRLRHVDWIQRLRPCLQRALPILIPLYVLTVLGVNGLLRINWRSFEEVKAQFTNTLGLLPFWNWYIVSKAQAMRSLVVHIIMYLPVGLMLSLRKKEQPGDAWRAAVIAFIFALLVEAGKCFAPDQGVDFYEAVPAALAGWLAVKMMPGLWRLLEMPVTSIGVSGGTPPGAGSSRMQPPKYRQARER